MQVKIGFGEYKKSLTSWTGALLGAAHNMRFKLNWKKSLTLADVSDVSKLNQPSTKENICSDSSSNFNLSQWKILILILTCYMQLITNNNNNKINIQILHFRFFNNLIYINLFNSIIYCYECY